MPPPPLPSHPPHRESEDHDRFSTSARCRELFTRLPWSSPPSMTKYQEALFVASKYCEYVLYRMYYRYHTERRNSLSAPLRPYSAMRGDVRGRLAATGALSYILQRPI